MKRFIKLSLLLLAALLPATATAYDFEVDGIYYLINGTEATVTYKNYSNGYHVSDYTGNLSIPSTVTYNGITYSVTSIGDYAFSDCSGLTSITIPNSVTTIGEAAFSGCSGLTSISIPNSVTIIGVGTFTRCSGLTSIDIPNSVTSIGEIAFDGCTKLTSIDIPNSVTTIGECAFSDCSGLTSISIPNSVTSIGRGAFASCSGLTSVIIGNSVTTIGDYAFFDCTGLTSVIIGNSVTTIGDYAFENCIGIVQLTWNAINCSSNGDMPTSNIEQVTIGNEVQIIPNSFVSYSKITEVTVPISVTEIGGGAFYSCSSLTSVVIPNSVTKIGSGAFKQCSALNDVYSYITNPSTITMSSDVFAQNPNNYAERTLHVPVGTVSAYQANTRWSQYFGSIVEMELEFVLATSIELNRSNVEVNVGETIPLLATVLPEDATDKTVTWASSDENVAMVDENGLVTAVAPGTVTITATTNDGSDLNASCNVTVLQGIVLAESIKLNVTTAGLNEGSTLQLTATVLPEDCDNKTVLWSSDNPSVATVDSNGLVTTHSVGTATITAMTTDGSNLSTTCTVTLLPVGVKGDTNGDIEVSIADVTALINFLLTGNW